MSDLSEAKADVYGRLITWVFEKHYVAGAETVEFARDEMIEAAVALGLGRPKNLGDVLYSFRYRRKLPCAIVSTAPDDREWIIETISRSNYRFRLVRESRISPNPHLQTIKVPEATPEIIAKYAQSDEQALLAKVRYNRLIDVFLGLTAYSLQNHLRTSVRGEDGKSFQVEIDEVYVGVDTNGAHYVIPVQAKGGSDTIGVVQIGQDRMWCNERMPELVARQVAAQFMADDVIAMFELVIDDDQVVIRNERHYKLVPASEITKADLDQYRLPTPSP